MAQGGLDRVAGDQNLVDVLIARGRTTVALLSFGVFGGGVFGFVLALLAARRRGILDGIVTAASAVAVALPPTVWVAVSPPGYSYAAALMVGAGATTVFFYQGQALEDDLGSLCVLSDRSYGFPPRRILWRSLRRALPTSVAHTAANLPFLMTTAFVVEHVFSLPGIGAAMVAAVRAGDVTWLMAVAVAMATASALLHIAADIVRRLADPRLEAIAGPKRAER
jgi:ABC-type dipeptide/oligopeptide/nickel transport system permease component